MASREEEKRKRREERLAAEQAHAAAARRARIVRLAAAVLAIAAVVVVVVLAAGGGSGDAGPAPASDVGADIKLPEPKELDLEKAAEAAGCVLKTFPSQGQGHTSKKVDYKTNPPTSGPHDPVAALDGIYDPENSPSAEKTVHSLEHGRVDIQYRPGTSAEQIAQLEALVSEPLNGTPGFLVLLFQNQTKMPYAVAATAWTQLLGCPKLTPEVFDAVRDFRTKYTDQGPEKGIPPTS